MGLYRAKFDAVGREWQTEYVEDGKVTPQEGRLVAVGDSGYGKVDDAAAGIIPKAIKHPGVPTLSVRQNGCDLHFTPGKKRLGGMVRYNALKEDSSRASALHLAASMEQAKNTKGVIWIADKGGSVMLTQALRF